MKSIRLGLSLFLALFAACDAPLVAQQSQQPPPTLGKPSDQNPPPTLSKPSDQNPPTLGEGPSLSGPHAANTNDARKLAQIHTVFIEPIDNDLSDKLTEGIGTKGPFHIVADRRNADALLRGTCFDSTRLKTVHSEVFLTSRNGDAIWQDIVRQPYRPPPLAQAVAATADAIVEDLTASVRESQER